MAQQVASAPSPRLRGAGRRKTAAPEGTSARYLWRARPRHQQLPAADRPPERGRLHRARRLFAHRPAGRGPVGQRQAQPGIDGPGGRGAGGLRRQASAPPCHAGALGRDRGLPPRRQRPRVRRAGQAGDRHRAGDHRPAGGSAAGGARLPQAARAGRRTGADLRYRRRIDRAGAGRAGRARARASAPGGRRRGAWSR